MYFYPFDVGCYCSDDLLLLLIVVCCFSMLYWMWWHEVATKRRHTHSHRVNLVKDPLADASLLIMMLIIGMLVIIFVMLIILMIFLDCDGIGYAVPNEESMDNQATQGANSQGMHKSTWNGRLVGWAIVRASEIVVLTNGQVDGVWRVLAIVIDEQFHIIKWLIAVFYALPHTRNENIIYLLLLLFASHGYWLL